MLNASDPARQPDPLDPSRPVPGPDAVPDPVREPRPDRLPDEEPLPNPDEGDTRPHHATVVSARPVELRDSEPVEVLSPREARQGRKGWPILWVLVGGLVLAMLAWALAEFFGAASEQPQTLGSLATLIGISRRFS